MSKFNLELRLDQFMLWNAILKLWYIHLHFEDFKLPPAQVYICGGWGQTFNIIPTSKLVALFYLTLIVWEGRLLYFSSRKLVRSVYCQPQLEFHSSFMLSCSVWGQRFPLITIHQSFTKWKWMGFSISGPTTFIVLKHQAAHQGVRQ